MGHQSAAKYLALDYYAATLAYIWWILSIKTIPQLLSNWINSLGLFHAKSNLGDTVRYSEPTNHLLWLLELENPHNTYILSVSMDGNCEINSALSLAWALKVDTKSEGRKRRRREDGKKGRLEERTENSQAMPRTVHSPCPPLFLFHSSSPLVRDLWGKSKHYRNVIIVLH